jgi:hypothetical protein
VEKDVSISPSAQKTMKSFRRQLSGLDRSRRNPNDDRVITMCYDLTIYWREFSEEFKSEVRQALRVDESNPGDVLVALR